MRLTPQQAHIIAQSLDPFQPAVIYVFGSHGTAAQHPQSDLDLAFLPMSSVDAYRVFEMANELVNALGIELDLVDLSKASTVMRKEVLRTGQAFAVRDQSAMREFEMRTLSDYARLNEERHEVLATL
jgi:predicted nucleotidyltransferase